MIDGLPPLECSTFYCGAVATVRCMVSNLPYCSVHAERHSPISREVVHAFRSIPLRLLPVHTECPRCGRTVRIEGQNGTSTVVCRSWGACDWQEALA